MMKKKCFLLVLLITVLFSFQVVSAEVDYTKEADMLNSLGLFNGTQNGYELDRVPTRVESAAMLVRLLGAEKEANEMKFEHPFTDVPEWANNIVGYMYEKGYTKGISDNLFGSSHTTIARDYTTFMLRSLGYSSDSDFNYLESLNFATSNGILSSEEAEIFKGKEFKRNEMVLISYRTLKASVKGEDALLTEKLVNSGVIDAQKAYDAGVADFEVLPVKVYNENGKLKIDHYYEKLSPELLGLKIRTSGSNNKEDYSDKSLLARTSILTDDVKKKLDGIDNNIGETYFSYMNEIVRFYDEDYILSYYCLIPDNLTEGEHYFVIRKVTDDVKDLMKESEKEFLEYRAEKIKKISEIPSQAYKIEEIDGKYYITIDKNKLPESMKNAVYYGQSGVSDDEIKDDIERMLKNFYSKPDAHRLNGEFVEGEPIELIYSHTFNQITLLDEFEDVIGITILDPQY